MTDTQRGISRREALTVALALTCVANSTGCAESKKAESPKISVEQAKQTLATIRALHTEKKPSQAGDWLLTHPEDGQTFAQFLKAHPQRACDKYRRLYLQPLGDFTAAQEKVLAATVECMEHFFGMPVVTNEVLSLADLPASARRTHPTWKMPQVLSTHLLDKVLKPRCPRDAAALLGLTASDLWPGEDWNFVFGQASLVDRVGVWSIYRNGEVEGNDEERTLFLRRTLQTALHETGHMFGIPHCIAYECGMNGSNSLRESDRQPMEFCPECQAKVWWTCGVLPRERYEKLLAFAKEHQLDDEAKFWEQSLAKLSPQ